MKIMFSPDSFKGTLSARQVCEIWTEAARRHIPDADCISLPVADGGEGLIAAVKDSLEGEEIRLTVSDPLGRPQEAAYLMLADGTAVIEMAAASGLPLLSPSERNPKETTSFGTGQLIADALDRGAGSLILGIGGSATNDGGAGAALALGLRLCCRDGSLIRGTGGDLGRIHSIDTSGLHPRFRDVPITIACDVDNPLCGPLGASAIYGPQKGASPEDVTLLDENLAYFAKLLSKSSGRTSIATLAGSGAAGGFSLPFLAYGNTRLAPGISIVLDILKYDALLTGCDLVITGEGKTDAQSAMGKVIDGVSARAAKQGIPVIVLSGAVDKDADALYEKGVTAIFSTCTTVAPLEEVLASARENLERAADNLFRLLAGLTK